MPIVTKAFGSKRQVNIKSRLSSQHTAKVKTAFPSSQEIRHVLRELSKNRNSGDYENLICLIRDSEPTDENLQILLETALECIHLLNLNLRLFVEAILLVKWCDRSPIVIVSYEKFVINLLSAHNYHSKCAIDNLVSNFLRAIDSSEWHNGVPNNEDSEIFQQIHSIIKKLLKVIPMSRDLLMQSLNYYYPYFKRPTHHHEIYVHNLLLILLYEPELRSDILHLIFSKLVILDVNAPIEDIREAEAIVDDLECLEELSDDTKHQIARSLDVCLDKVFNYFIIASHDTETGQTNMSEIKSLYRDMLGVFDQILLPTHNINHTQFIMFLLCSFNSTITEVFLKYLWEKVCAPDIPPVHRHTAVVYVASLVARGSFVTINVVKVVLRQLADWIHSYIVTQDGLECVNSDVRIHFVFYSVCQALFYIIAFRHTDLVTTKKSVIFLENLNLVKIVTCRLNPLRVCGPVIVRNFASVTRTYQLVYCYAIIEHNSRNVIPTLYQDERGTTEVCFNKLESFFPFDPYLLKRSGKKILPIYLKYRAKPDINAPKKSESNLMDTDDYIQYGSSPGFK